MPFQAPGAAAMEELQQALLRREMQKRQDMLDSLKQQKEQADIANQQASRELQSRGLDIQQQGQDLMNTQRTDALAETKRKEDAALAAVQPPTPGLVGNVPSQFAMPMDTPSDTSGIGTTAPTAGGSAWQEARQKAAEAQALKQLEIDNRPVTDTRPNSVREFEYNNQQRAAQGLPAQTYEQYQNADANRHQAPVQDAAVTLTPAGLDIAARRFAMDGSLPPMGMGKQGAAVRTAIINRAAQLDPTLNTGANKAEQAANSASLTQLQKNADAVDAFAKTAESNRAVFDTIAKDVPDSGMPLFNGWLRSSAAATGNTAVSKFNTIRQSLQSEYARLVSQPSLGGQLSDSARKEIETALSPNATVAQMKAALDTFATESNNRKNAIAGQLSEVRGRMSGSGSGAPRVRKFNPTTGTLE
jgi:hypothetical protein